MEKLPPEIVENILCLLDSKTIMLCRQVCREWWILTSRIVCPLYIPRVIKKVILCLQQDGLQNIKNFRLVCKIWKEGLDKFTLWDTSQVYLNGLTNISSHSPFVLSYRIWNPFPTRIVRAKLCYGHDDAENSEELIRNLGEDQFVEWFGEHILYFQVSLQHSNCAEKHLTKVLCHLKNLRGLVISESVSPFRFSKRKQQLLGSEEERNLEYHVGQLENLRFLKLDDADTKLKYSELYKTIIENSPKLEHLEINGYHHLDMDIVRLLSNRQSRKLTKLKIDAEDPNTKETLEILNRADFPSLTFLSIRVNGYGDYDTCMECTSLLHSSLQKIGSTLTRLELKLIWFENSEDIIRKPLLTIFPSSKYLISLNRLKLVGFLGNIDFLNDLSKLNALMIVDREDLAKTGDQFKHLHPNLQEVHFPMAFQFHQTSSERKKYWKNFMYEGDDTFISKYCGLHQEGFP